MAAAALPSSMRAIVIHKYGDVNVLVEEQIPLPTLLPRDVLVRIHAISTNPVDVKVRTNVLNAPELSSRKILGWDAAGVVVALGSEARTLNIGDEVYFSGSIVRDGCYAEYCAVDERIVGKKPKNLSFEEAAAEALTALTAYEAIFEAMRVPEDFPPSSPSARSILIINGAGGVGSVAIQIAKKLCGLRTIATASRPETIEFCRKMGADDVINHREEVAPQIERLGLKGVDYIFHCADLDSENLQKCLALLNPFGHFCYINSLPGTTIQLDANTVLFKRISLHGELMFTRPMIGIDIEKQAAILNRHADLLEKGVFVSRLTRTYGDFFADIRRAHEAQASGRAVGKQALTVRTANV